MFIKHSTRARHGSGVIDQHGNPLEDTWVGRLRFAGGLARRVEDDEPTVPLPAVAVGPSRVLPVRGHGVVALRVPQRPRVSPADWVRFGFARAARELNEFVQVVSTGWRKASAENDARAARLDERLEALGRRVRVWTIESMDQDLSLAYAEGGTERVLRMTPEVLARLDAVKAAAGSAVTR